MRQTIIAGNWKMNCVRAEAESLVKDLLPLLSQSGAAQVVVCPPYPLLGTVGAALEGSGAALGAQDVFWKAKGAYTGQVSAAMLLDVGCQYVIVGHSERRGRFGVPEPDFDANILAHFGDTNDSVNRKVLAALAAGLTPIVCVGETLSERQQNDTDPVVAGQTQIVLRGVTAEQAARLVFAYEPVWAIGTGEVCHADEADRVCGLIRGAVAALYDAETAESVRIQYGGSMKPDNAAELLAKPNIDGGLIGGASLKAADFAAIIAAA